MKKLKLIITPFLMFTFLVASLICCCLGKTVSASTTLTQPSCHKQTSKNQSANPTQNDDRPCCQQMLKQAVTDQGTIKTLGLIKVTSHSLIPVIISYAKTVSSLNLWTPISPQQFPTIALYLKNHVLRV